MAQSNVQTAKIEIERKFLVKNLNFVKYGVPHRILQGYVCVEDNKVVRVRTKDKKGYITIKNASIGFARHEFEYEIPHEDALMLIDRVCEKPTINKTRFDLIHKGKKWEVDVFNNENEGLIIAEIELEKADEEILKPEFVGEEVTDDYRYYNSYISRNPYNTWK